MFGDDAVKWFCVCNIYKYKKRANLKNGEEDLAKADWYVDYLVKMRRESEPSFAFKNEDTRD